MDDSAIKSFNAIRSFLAEKEYFKSGYLPVEIIIDSSIGKHYMKDDLEISFYELNAIYNFYSNCFHSYIKTTKICSSDYLFEFNESTKELFTFHEDIKISIKKRK